MGAIKHCGLVGADLRPALHPSCAAGRAGPGLRAVHRAEGSALPGYTARLQGGQGDPGIWQCPLSPVPGWADGVIRMDLGPGLRPTVTNAVAEVTACTGERPPGGILHF